MGAKSKIIAIAHFEDIKDEWLDYPVHYYEGVKKNSLVHIELVYCETASKSLELIECFKVKGLSDFNNHLIHHNMYWKKIKAFDVKYRHDLKDKLKTLLAANAVIMFLPEF